MYCEKCGAEIQEGVKFCSCCGRKVAENGSKKGSTKAIVIVGIVIVIAMLVGGGIFYWKKGEQLKQKEPIVENSQKETEHIENNKKILKTYECILKDNSSTVIYAEAGYTIHCKYDKNGKKIYQLDDMSGSYSLEYTYTYSELGNLSTINMIYYDKSGKVRYESEDIFNEKEQIILKNRTDYIDGVKSVETCVYEYTDTYNEKNELILNVGIEYINGIKSGETVISYIYNENGECIPSKKHTYTCDESGKILSEGDFEWCIKKNEWNEMARYSYVEGYEYEYHKEYNEYGDIIKDLSDSSRTGRFLELYDLAYDESGNILNKTRQPYFGRYGEENIENLEALSPDEWFYKYKFDEDGNILSKYAYEGEITNLEDWSYYCTWTYYE